MAEKGRGGGKRLAQAHRASERWTSRSSALDFAPVSGTTGRGRPRESGLTAADLLELSLRAGGLWLSPLRKSPLLHAGPDNARYMEGEKGPEKPRGWSRSPRWTVKAPGQGAPT